MDSIPTIQDFIYRDIIDLLVDGATVPDWMRETMPEIGYLEQQAALERQELDRLERMGNSIANEAQPQDVQSLQQGQGRADWIQNNAVARFGADTVGAAGIGAANMLNNTVLGGAGLVLSGLGRGIEAISPFSGLDEKATRQRERLRALGYLPRRLLPNTRVYNDSWLTTAAKGTLGLKNFINEYVIDPSRTYMLGENPTKTAKVAEGVGSVLGFLAAGYAANLWAGLPGFTGWVGGLTKGGLESLSEAGGFIADAYKRGQYGDDVLAAAAKNFAANVAVNSALELGSKGLGTIVNNALPQSVHPFVKHLVGGAGEVLNEVLQEPSQHVIEEASTNSLNNGTDFFNPFNLSNSELVKSGKKWPQVFAELAPETALATIIATLLTGAGGAYHINKYNRKMRTEVPEAIGKLERQQSILNQQIPNLDSQVADLERQRAELLNNPYYSGSTEGLGVNPANEDMDTNPDYQSELYDAATQEGETSSQADNLKSRADAMRSRAEYMRSENQSITEQLKTLKDYAESKPSWWEPDAPQELYDAMGRPDDTSMFTDEEDLRETPNTMPDIGEETSPFNDMEDIEETPTDESGNTDSATEQLVDDEPDEDLDDSSAFDRAVNNVKDEMRRQEQEWQNAEAANTQQNIPTAGQATAQNEDLLPPSSSTQGTEEQITSPMDSLLGNNQNNSDIGSTLLDNESYTDDIADKWQRLLEQEGQNETQDSEGETYSQSTQQRNQRNETNAGDFTFTTRTGKQYKARVVATDSNNSDSGSDAASTRLRRYRGRRLEVRNSRGKVLATYYPYHNSFELDNDFRRKHSDRWLQSFKSQFMGNAQGYLANGGFLDSKNNLVSDGNEGMRTRWDALRQSDRQDYSDRFYDNNTYPEDAYDTTSTQSRTATPNAQSTQTGKQHKGRKGGIVDSIRNIVNGEIYHQSEAGNAQGTQTAGAPSDANTFTVRTGDGKNYSFRVRAGEFDDKHSRQKKLFGRFLEVVDDADNVIARYSPYIYSFEFSKHAPKDGATRQAIKNTINNSTNLAMTLSNNGFLDEKGHLIDDGNTDFRNEVFGKTYEARNIADYMRDKKAEEERREKMTYSQRVKEDFKKGIKGIASDTKKRWDNTKSTGKSIGYRAVQFMSDILDSPDGRKTRRTIKKKLQKAKVYNGQQRDALSRIIAAQVMHLASYTGIYAQKLLDDYFFDIQTDFSPTGGLDRDSETGEFVRDQYGNYQENRGTYRHIKADEPDHFGNAVDHARNLIYLYRGHNISTMIHEPAHFFLKVMQDLFRQGELKEKHALQNWETLVKYLELEGVDLKKAPSEMTQEEKDKWKAAHEKFATSAEKYIMTGQAPKLKLARAFEVLKRYMGDVYSSVGTIKQYMGTALTDETLRRIVDDEIQYVGADRKWHSYTMSDEAMELLDRIYSGKPKKSGKSKSTRTDTHTDTSTDSGGESYNQRISRETAETEAWSKIVDRFVNGEINRRNDGNLLHVMDTPIVFTLADMDRLPIEIRLDNMHKILLRKHHIKPETLKQIPKALADPIMIFKSEHDNARKRDSRIVLTELKETGTGGKEHSIIAAITLGKSNLSKGYAINELTTVYKKDTSSKQGLTPEEDIYDWITRTFKDGTPMNLLLYINKEKARKGAISSGMSPMVFDTLNRLSDSIPNEHDLAKLISHEEESYNQPVNADVDLDSSISVVQISPILDDVPFHKRMKAFDKKQQAKILSKFADGSVVNKHTGLTISLSNQGLNHILSTARWNDNLGGRISYQAIPYLDKLATEAYRIETHEDRKPKDINFIGRKGSLKQVHRFFVPVEFNGEQHILKLTAKEYETGRAEIDEISLYDMKYTKKMPSHPSTNSPNSIGQATQTVGSPSTISVREMLKDVNDVEVNPYLSDSASVNGDSTETYNQRAIQDGELNVGELVFPYRSKTYKFKVVATDRRYEWGSGISAERMRRYNGRWLEVRTPSGKVLQEYHPYWDGEEWWGEAMNGHHKIYTKRWIDTYDRHFKAHLQDYLQQGGFLDENGNLKPDGNEEMRRRWDALKDSDQRKFYNMFDRNEVFPEDGDGYTYGQAEDEQPKSKGDSRKSKILGGIRNALGSSENIRRTNDSFITPERYEQLVYHATGNIILGNKFDLQYIGTGNGARLYGWGIYFSDSKEDVNKYRRTGLKSSDTDKHGNLYIADIPENNMLLNWNARLSEQSDEVKQGIRRAIARTKQLGATDNALRKLLTAKTGEDFYHALETVVPPLITKLNKKGMLANDMAASLLLNQAGIPGLYHENRYLDNATLKTKSNRNFVVWNTDMIKILSISPDSDLESKFAFKSTKDSYLHNRSTRDLGREKAQSTKVLNDETEKFLDNLEEALRKSGITPESYSQSAQSTEGFPFNNETYNQLAMRADNMQQSLKIAQAQLDAVRRKYEGTDQWMKAPNGKSTKLTEKQWLQVRTPNFKAWFGDWENDPANASKVLDENGEPLVVYHISRNGGGFSVFNTNGDFSVDYGSKTANTGAWFADFKDNYDDMASNLEEGSSLYHVFLNIRNPYVYDAEGKRWQRVGKVWIEDENGNRIYHDNDGRAFSNLSWAKGYIRDKLNNDSRYHVEFTKEFQTSDELVRAVREGRVGNGNNDGVIIKNLREMSYWGVDDYIVFNPEQVKSATDNNGNFDPRDPDIYHQSIPPSRYSTANGAPSLLRKYSNILNNSNPNDIDVDNLTIGNEGFISLEMIEQYNQQDVTHATGHILINNKFDLRYIGSGEGTQFFGHGIYLEENPEVAEHYRKYGIPNFGKGTIHVHTDRGMTYSASNKDSWDNSPDTAMRKALNLVLSSAISNPAFFAEQSFDEIKEYHLNHLNLELQNYKTYKPTATSEIEKIERTIQAINSITGFDFSPDENSHRRGNIYRVRIPDNDMLLQWDALLQEQSEHVKKAISKIEDVIYDMASEYDLDLEEYKRAKTGEDLYRAISNIMEQYLENNSPKDGITNPDERTSLLFNRFGVLGHRYWDNFSREELRKKFEDYRAKNPIQPDRSAFSVITTADGKQYNSDSTAWLAIWKDKSGRIIEDRLLREVLDELQRKFDTYRNHKTLETEKKDLLSTYSSRIESNLREIGHKKQPLDYFIDKDQLRAENADIQRKIDILTSIVSFEYHPAIKNNPQNAYSIFGNEGTHNFVIWNEDAMRVLGLTEDSDQDAIDYYNRTKQLKDRLAAVGTESYAQSYKEADDIILTPEARRQIETVRKQYESTDQWMKAPNGQPTKLTERQWLAVRTPNFIRWFGDWLNDPEHASKIVDENGEPLVVWHGSSHGGFSIFDTKGIGSFFNDNKDVAFTYLRGELSEDKLYPVFLNIRNPYIMGGDNKFWSTLFEYHLYDNYKKRNVLVKKDGSNFTSKEDATDYIKHTLHDHNNKRYSVVESNPMTTDELARFVWRLKKGGSRRYDGIILNNIYDIGSIPTKAMNLIGNDFIAIAPEQIKSATRNNGDYDGTNREIYHQIIGKFGAEKLDKAEGVTTRMDALRIAKAMTRAGRDAKYIKLATGWELGHDGSWKFEIMDGKLLNNHGKDNIPLQELFDAPELYKAYPEFRNILVKFDIELDWRNTLKAGYWDKKNNTIHLQKVDKTIIPYVFNAEDKYSKQSAESIRGTLIHEIQHAIQAREGFASGANPSFFRDWHKIAYLGEVSYLSEDEAYKRTAGEVEARNTKNRMNMTEEERRNTTLAETEDIKPQKQLIFHNLEELDNESKENVRHDEIDENLDDDYNAYLDSLDNDSDLIDYSSSDYEQELNDYASGLIEAQDYDGFDEIHYPARQDMPEHFNQQINAWSDTVNKVLDKDIPDFAYLRMIDTPSALQLVGLRPLPVYMRAKKMHLIQEKHPSVTNEILSQISYALADPIAIFKDKRRATHKTVVVMTDIVDSNGATVIVPIFLNERANYFKKSYRINRVASVYAKLKSHNEEAKNSWFIDKVEAGDLLFLNRNKAAAWEEMTGEHLPVENTTTPFLTEKDLAEFTPTSEIHHTPPALWLWEEVEGVSGEELRGLEAKLTQTVEQPATEQQDNSLSEQYHQLIGVDGARALDLAEGVTTRMYNLKKAKRMEKSIGTDAGISIEKIWKETGWARGADGKWRMDIPDGKLTKAFTEWRKLAKKRDALDAKVTEAFNKAKAKGIALNEIDDYLSDVLTPKEQELLDYIENYNPTLSKFYDAPELYTAYPELRDLPVYLDDLGEDTNAEFRFDHIVINQNIKSIRQIRKSLIHEIQHAIQEMEGFARGAAFDIDNDATFNKLMTKIKDTLDMLRRYNPDNADTLQYAVDNLDSNSFSTELKAIISAGVTEKELQLLSDINDLYEDICKRYFEVFDIYHNTAGEVDARNAAFRAGLSKGARRRTPPNMTEDVPFWEQIIGRIPRKTRLKSSNSEQYHQVLGVEGARQLDRFEGNNWRMYQLDMAIKMTKEGADAKAIRLATNWELAPDGKWRYEINDGKLDTRGIKEALKAHKGNYPFSVNLQEVLNNPELFKAYPQLATLKVFFRDDMKRGLNGRYHHNKDDFSKSRIAINTKSRTIDGMQSTLLHEVQHAIQYIEGFAQGGSNADWLISGSFIRDNGMQIINDYLNSLDDKKDKQLKRFGELLLRGERSKAEQIRLKLKSEWHKQTAYKIANMIDSFTKRAAMRLNPYDYLGGEVEARNVQSRRYMTDHERRITPLSKTQDTSAWLIRGTDNPSNYKVLTDYNTGQRADSETYHQIIGEKGARALDLIEGVTTRMDALKTAKQMQADGEDARVIRRTTGWELAPDDKWRYEIRDGDIDVASVGNALDDADYELPITMELKDVYNNPDLFNSIVQDLKGVQESKRIMITPAMLEGYDQLVTHATGNIILGNKFNLRYVGSGEGSSAFGYGAYFEQNREIAEIYRWLSLSDEKRVGVLHLRRSDGVEFVTDYTGKWRRADGKKVTGDALQAFLKQYFSVAASSPSISHQEILDDLDRKYKNNLKAMQGLAKDNDRWAKNISALQAQQKYIKKFVALERTNQSKGNIYIFDIPEDYELMDWDARLSEQPEQVKQHIDEMVKELLRRGYSKQQILGVPKMAYLDGISVANMDTKDITGGALYQNIVDILSTGETKKALAEGMVKASTLFNEFGISGHRFWDRGSRDAKSGTHNFVIWAESRIKMMGIDPTSDQDAIDYYNRTKQLKDSLAAVDAESYTQPAQHSEIKKRIHDSLNSKNVIGMNGNGQTQAISIPEQQLEAVRRKYQGTDQWLKAPNGEKTNLTERQWLQVRTPNFKAWFGDWENDPEHASKVLDKNGEPLVVYHGTAQGGFSIFNTNGDFSQGDWYKKTTGTGAFFHSNYYAANTYTFDSKEHHNENSQIYATFLNIRNPFIYDAHGKSWDELGEVWIYDNETGEEFGEKKDGSIFLNEQDAYNYISDTLGDKEYERYQVFADDEYHTTDDIVRVVWNNDILDWSGEDITEPYDGVIFRNIDDVATHEDGHSMISDVYVTRTPENIKSATDTNGNFDPRDPDIYHQIITNIEDFMLTPEARKQMEAVRRKYEGTPQWLKAPNGKTSNYDFISEKTWLQVRTPNFKAWFGDWENDPKHASKILDENGEPLVLVHMAEDEFSVFDTDREGMGVDDPETPFAIFMAKPPVDENLADRKYAMFLFADIRNPFIVKNRDDVHKKLKGYTPYMSAIKKIDAMEHELDELADKSLNVADNSKEERELDKIIAAKEEQWFNEIRKAKKLLKEWLIDNGYDGMIMENDLGVYTVIALNRTQVKSAIANNGNYSRADPDVYHQIIGEKGARRLDMLEGVTTRLDALKRAKQMQADGEDAKDIWQKTGWVLGVEGKWKMELPYGNIIDNKIKHVFTNEHANALYLLMEVFDAPELFKAYPRIANINVFFTDKIQEDRVGEYRSQDNEIWIKSGMPAEETQSVLIHEIQHAIQHIEGFAIGGDETTGDYLRWKADAWAWRNELLATEKEHPELAGTLELQNFLIQEYRKSGFTDDEMKPSSARIKGFNLYVRGYDNEGYERAHKQVYGSDAYSTIHWGKWAEDYDTQHRLAGEVEARNAATRSLLSESERKGTIPTDTEEARTRFAPERTQKYQGKQVVVHPEDLNDYSFWWQSHTNNSNENYGQPARRQMNEVNRGSFSTNDRDVYHQSIRRSNDSFLTQEKYEQLAYHGTPNKILGNRFNLRFINTGTGTQTFGWGLYFTSDREFADSYRGHNPNRGNLYEVDIPENDMLLNWNATMDNQPAKIKRGINSVIEKLKRFGVRDNVLNRLQNAKTGRDFYYALSEAMELLMNRLKGLGKLPAKITRPDMAASLFLNQAGIPGLRHLELGSLNTQSFVIWNTDMIKILGISADSDKEAIDYYERSKQHKDRLATNSEQYHQIIGEQGAHRLDKALGVKTRITALKKAKKMKREKASPREIWEATGWSYGKDKKWRMEIMDGILNPELFNEDGELIAHPKGNLTLKDIYLNDDLFAAYPDLADLPVEFTSSYTGNSGTYSSAGIGISQIAATKLSTLVHEFQHAIQKREGFSTGANYLTTVWQPPLLKHTMQNYREIIKDMNTPKTLEHYARGAWGTDIITDEIRKAYKDYLKSFKKVQPDDYFDRAAQKGAAEETYRRVAGEVEARNAALRATWDEDKRRSTPLDETEDRPRDKQISYSHYDFIPQGESYSQSAQDRDMDKRYFDALNAGDMETARAIVDEQARRKGYSADDSFRMSHRAPVASDNFGPNMAEVKTSGIVPDDYWTHPEWYTSSPEERDAFYSVSYAIDRYEEGLKEGKHYGIKVYRAVPKNVKDTKLRNGDWVSPSRDYAVQHGQGNLNSNYRIIEQTVPLRHLWWDGNSIAEWGYDDNEHNYVYRNTKNNRKLNDTIVQGNDFLGFKEDENGHLIRDEDGHLIAEYTGTHIIPPSQRFNYRAEEEYHQPANLENNPLIERYNQLDTFGNPDTEKEYTGGLSTDVDDKTKKSITDAFKDIWHGFAGDFPELTADSKFREAREVLRMMGRQTEAKPMLAVQDLVRSIKGLNARQLNIFSRFMLLQDIYSFHKQNPNAKFPLGFTAKSFNENNRKFTALATSDAAIKKAIEAEYKSHREINERLAQLAEKLGLPNFADKVRHNEFYVLDYVRLLKGNGINTNYLEAVATYRAQQLRDIEHITAILRLRSRYNVKAALVKKFGKDWRKHIPKGYKIFNPLQGHFIQSANTLTENFLGVALEVAGKKLGLSEETMHALRSKVSDNSGSHLLVFPEALADTLDQLAVPKVRGDFGKIVKDTTTQWKRYTLFFPTRAIKYNIRNMTGDLDAVLAGNPKALRFLPRAMSELWEVYYGNGTPSTELREFQKRGGAITIQTTQDMGDYKQLKEYKRLLEELKGKKPNDWAKLPRAVWKLFDKFAWSGIQNFSDFREQWLRYACYLEYLHQMKSNDAHLPRNWGASVKEEVLSIPAKNEEGIRHRAFKMSNELLGAYDQVSRTGRELRDIAIPFYSWMEVNAKRYYRLIKNGITDDGLGDFASSVLKGQLANIPYYGFKLAKTYILVNLLAMLISAFNHFVWPKDEEKLPPNIKDKIHITLGHDTKGNVLYFERVGAMLDNLEWFGQEESPFFPFAKDIKEIFNGRQSFTDFAWKLITSPINKVVSGINPIVKTPFEVLTGKSLYPDVTHPRNIRDNGAYFAQSFGLSWPYKNIMGTPVDNWTEFKKLFMYQADADEAAYFYTLGLVREFQERVLGKRLGGFATTQRGNVLYKMKTALRLGNKEDVQRYLQEYYRLGGDKKGLKASMRNMNPLHGLNKQEQAQFKAWISEEDKEYLAVAEAFYDRITKPYLEDNKNTKKKKKKK